jgi:hypothetical protein
VNDDWIFGGAPDGDRICECCSKEEYQCECTIDEVRGNDPETGPWAETVCLDHGRRMG